MMPLHLAAENQAELEVVEALLLAYPDAASKRDEVRCAVDVGHCVCSVQGGLPCMGMWVRYIVYFRMMCE